MFIDHFSTCQDETHQKRSISDFSVIFSAKIRAWPNFLESKSEFASFTQSAHADLIITI